MLRARPVHFGNCGSDCLRKQVSGASKLTKGMVLSKTFSSETSYPHHSEIGESSDSNKLDRQFPQSAFPRVPRVEIAWMRDPLPPLVALDVRCRKRSGGAQRSADSKFGLLRIPEKPKPRSILFRKQSDLRQAVKEFDIDHGFLGLVILQSSSSFHAMARDGKPMMSESSVRDCYRFLFPPYPIVTNGWLSCLPCATRGKQ